MDDLIPYQQSVRTVKMLQKKGIKSDVKVMEGEAHLFDSSPKPRVDFEPGLARAYAWLRKVVFDS